MKRKCEQYFTKLSIGLLIVLGFSIQVHSQIAGGLNETTGTHFRGAHFISGTIFLPSGRPINQRMRIRLSVMGGEVISNTDDSGKFVFSGLSNGTYTISIDEPDYEQAFQQIEIDYPRNSPPQVHSVSIRLIDKRRSDERLGVINAEVAAIPKQANDNYQKALSLSAEGKHKEAIERLLTAVKRYPEFVAAYTELGVQYVKLDNFQKADEYFLKALTIKPDSFEPLINRGILLVRLKRFVEAQTVLAEARKANDSSALVNLYLGRALAGEERFSEAEKELLMALEKGGAEMNEARRILANIYLETGNDEKAVNELEKYLTESPNVSDADKLRDYIKQIKDHLERTQRP